MNIARLAGVVTGLIIGLIIAFFFIRMNNTDHKLKTEYDERQQILRGRGYMYAFYGFLAYECVMLSISMAEISLPIPDYILHFGGILIGCTVLGVYCIWNDVYWGLNNNRKRYGFFFVVCAALNAIPVIGSIREGSLVTDGKWNTPVINVMVLLMMLVFGVMLLVKSFIGGRNEEDV